MKHSRLCYLDIGTPFLAAPIFLVVPLALWRRIDLQQKLWPHGPSLRTLLTVYYASTMIMYVTDLVLLVAKRVPGSDVLSDGYGYMGVMLLYLLVINVMAGFWIKCLYSEDPNFANGYVYSPPTENIEAR